MTSDVKGRLGGRVAIVTGSSRGIGRATALAFAREGAKVVVNYRQRSSKAEEVVEEIEKLGGNATAFEADVGDRAAVEGMVEETLAEYGGVDILVNNAGVYDGAGSLMELDEDEFDPMWRVNVKGILHCTRAVTPHMIEMRYGKVVNIASTAGLGTAVMPGNMLYASTKAAVIILTKRLALELGQYGINVNAVAPGQIRTDMGMGPRSPSEQAQLEKYHAERSILRRIGEPEEVANVVLFLASDEASLITGQVLTVDGGRVDFITRSL